MNRCLCESADQFSADHAAWSAELKTLTVDKGLSFEMKQERRTARFRAALSAITSILDAVESARLEDNVDIDTDELIAGIRKQLRNAWGL